MHEHASRPPFYIKALGIFDIKVFDNEVLSEVIRLLTKQKIVKAHEMCKYPCRKCW